MSVSQLCFMLVKKCLIYLISALASKDYTRNDLSYQIFVVIFYLFIMQDELTRQLEELNRETNLSFSLVIAIYVISI